jgi:hypothetical protein
MSEERTANVEGLAALLAVLRLMRGEAGDENIAKMLTKESVTALCPRFSLVLLVPVLSQLWGWLAAISVRCIYARKKNTLCLTFCLKQNDVNIHCYMKLR